MARNGVDRFALVLVILGALNWLSVGLFRYDVVAHLFGGTGTLVARIIYSVIGIGGLYAISLLFRNREDVRD